MTVSDSRFTDIYERHYRDVYAYCRRRTTSDRVDDAVADTFLTAWRKITDVPPFEETLPWLYAVAYRVLGHQWRGGRRQANLRHKLRGIGVESVSPPEEILRLSVWEELRHQQIAAVLGINTDAVKKRYWRAKKNLAVELNRLERTRMKAPAAQKGGA